MIRLTDIDSRTVYVQPTHIVSITEARQNHHGINCIVRMVTGEVIEARETAKKVFDAYEAEIK